MSYILDALKKSEQERSRGTVPDIKSIHDQKPVAPPKRYHWHIIITVVLLLNAGGAGYWFYLKNNGTDAPQSDMKMNSAVAENAPQTDLRGTADLESANQQAAATQSAENSIKSYGESGLSKLLTSEAVSKPKTPATDKKEDKTAKPNVVFSEQPLTVSESELKNTEKAGTVANLSDVQISVEPDPVQEIADSQIYNISDLPDDIKSALPAISFAGHVYSSSASQSSVMINGKKMREGQQVSKDLILEQITVEGVVFRYQSYRFKLGALQDWSFQ